MRGGVEEAGSGRRETPPSTPQIDAARSAAAEDPAAAVLAAVRVVPADGSGGGRVEERREKTRCRRQPDAARAALGLGRRGGLLYSPTSYLPRMVNHNIPYYAFPFHVYITPKENSKVASRMLPSNTETYELIRLIIRVFFSK